MREAAKRPNQINILGIQVRSELSASFSLFILSKIKKLATGC
jgi:hypothetical protein